MDLYEILKAMNYYLINYWYLVLPFFGLIIIFAIVWDYLHSDPLEEITKNLKPNITIDRMDNKQYYDNNEDFGLKGDRNKYEIVVMGKGKNSHTKVFSRYTKFPIRINDFKYLVSMNYLFYIPLKTKWEVFYNNWFCNRKPLRLLKLVFTSLDWKHKFMILFDENKENPKDLNKEVKVTGKQITTAIESSTLKGAVNDLFPGGIISRGRLMMILLIIGVSFAVFYMYMSGLINIS